MSDEPEDLALDPEELAVQEQFLAEWRAGQRPRLSAYARRYPQYAAALANLVATLPPEAPASESATVVATSAEPLTESFPERLWSGAGVARALVDIFGGAADERGELRVAETGAAYQTPQGQDVPVGDAQRDERESD